MDEKPIIAPPTIIGLLAHLKDCGVHFVQARQFEPTQLPDFYVPPPDCRYREDTYISITDQSTKTREEVAHGIRQLQRPLGIEIDRSDPMLGAMAVMELSDMASARTMMLAIFSAHRTQLRTSSQGSCRRNSHQKTCPQCPAFP